MEPRATDAREYAFLTAPEAAVEARLEPEASPSRVLLLGNRAGLLSLANVFLWLVANAFRREFLSLGELPFVRMAVPLAVTVRLVATEPTGRDGRLAQTDRGSQVEWTVSEDDLRRTALAVHALVACPHREYYRTWTDDGSAAEVEFRLTDATAWM